MPGSATSAPARDASSLSANAGERMNDSSDGPHGGSLSVSGTVHDFQSGAEVMGAASVAATALSPLPTITDRVTIDGTTAPQFVSQPVIEIDGTSAGAASNGLSTTADGCVIRGLVINRFGTGGSPGGAGGVGILLQSTSNVIEGNFIGTDVTGLQARANRMDGVRIDHGGNRIGGTTFAARNVISGNGQNGVLIETGADLDLIAGNWIGIGVGGAVLGNALDGVNVNGSLNVVGGAASEGKVVSSA